MVKKKPAQSPLANSNNAVTLSIFIIPNFERVSRVSTSQRLTPKRAFDRKAVNNFTCGHIQQAAAFIARVNHLTLALSLARETYSSFIGSALAWPSMDSLINML